MQTADIPKDLSAIKNKIAFNLTKRQLICFGGAAFTGLPFYLLTRKALGTDIAMLGMIGLMVPWFLIGLYEKDGQPLEKIIYHMIRVKFLTPGSQGQNAAGLSWP